MLLLPLSGSLRGKKKEQNKKNRFFKFFWLFFKPSKMNKSNCFKKRNEHANAGKGIESHFLEH